MSWGKPKKEKIADKPKIKVPKPVVTPSPSPTATPTPPVPISASSDRGKNENRPLTMGLSWFCGWPKERPEAAEPRAVPGIQGPYVKPWDSFLAPGTVTRHGTIANARQMLMHTPGMPFGTYDERDPAVTLRQIQWMEEGGMDVCSIQVDWATEHTCPAKMPSWRGKLDTPLLMGHCAENFPADAKTKYFLSDWDVGVGDGLWTEMLANGWNRADVENSWRMRGREIGRHALKASYFTIGDRPVFQRGWLHLTPWYEAQFGITVAQISAMLREGVKAITGKDLYLISTCTEEATWPLHKEWGYNAVTQYALLGNNPAEGQPVVNDWASCASNHRLWWAKGLAFAKSSGLDFWVPASCGYDSSAWDSPEKVICMPTIPEYIAHIKEARALARDNYKYTRGIVHQYAATEIGEGGIWFPMADVEGNLHRGAEVMNACKWAMQ